MRQLQALVKLESDRRDNDARIVALYPEFVREYSIMLCFDLIGLHFKASTTAVLATLKPGFQHSQGLMEALQNITGDICKTFEDFGQFSE